MTRIPLIKGYSEKSIAENIRRLVKESYTLDQARIIALKTARKAKKKTGK